MTIITIKNNAKLNKTEFETIEELQLYLIQIQQEVSFSSSDKSLLDDSLLYIKNNSTKFLSLDELKSSMMKK